MELQISHDTKTVEAMYRREGDPKPVLVIGEMSYLNETSFLVYYDTIGTLNIGKYSSIAPNCRFHVDWGTHHPEWIATYPRMAMPWPTDVPRSDPASAFGSP